MHVSSSREFYLTVENTPIRGAHTNRKGADNSNLFDLHLQLWQGGKSVLEHKKAEKSDFILPRWLPAGCPDFPDHSEPAREALPLISLRGINAHRYRYTITDRKAV